MTASRLVAIAAALAALIGSSLVSRAQDGDKAPLEVAFFFRAKKGDEVHVRSRGSVTISRAASTAGAPPVRTSTSYELDRETRLVVLDVPKESVYRVEVRATRLAIDVDADNHHESFVAGKDDAAAGKSAFVAALVTPLDLVARGKLSARDATVELEAAEREAKDGRRRPAPENELATAQALLAAFAPPVREVRRLGDRFSVDERRADAGFDLVIHRACEVARVEAFRGRPVVRIDERRTFEVAAPPPKPKGAAKPKDEGHDEPPPAAPPPVPELVEGGGEATILVDASYGRALRTVSRERIVLKTTLGDQQVLEDRRARATVEELPPDLWTQPAPTPKESPR